MIVFFNLVCENGEVFSIKDDSFINLFELFRGLKNTFPSQECFTIDMTIPFPEIFVSQLKPFFQIAYDSFMWRYRDNPPLPTNFQVLNYLGFDFPFRDDKLMKRRKGCSNSSIISTLDYYKAQNNPLYLSYCMERGVK